MLRKASLFFALLLVALLTGRAFWTWLLDNPANFPANTYVAYFQAVDRVIALPIAVMGTAAALFTGIAAALSFRDRPVFALLITAFCCVIVSDFVTVHFHLPINRQIAGFNPADLPANWPALRDQWWEYHKIRVVALMLALGSVSLATVARTPSR